MKTVRARVKFFLLGLSLSQLSTKPVIRDSTLENCVSRPRFRSIMTKRKAQKGEGAIARGNCIMRMTIYHVINLTRRMTLKPTMKSIIRMKSLDVINVTLILKKRIH